MSVRRVMRTMRVTVHTASRTPAAGRLAPVRLFAPADHGKVEFADQSVGERHAGKTRQPQHVARRPDFDAGALGQRALPAPVTADPTVGYGAVQNVERERGFGAEDSACAASGVSCRAFTFGQMMGPPAEKA